MTVPLLKTSVDEVGRHLLEVAKNKLKDNYPKGDPSGLRYYEYDIYVDIFHPFDKSDPIRYDLQYCGGGYSIQLEILEEEMIELIQMLNLPVYCNFCAAHNNSLDSSLPVLLIKSTKAWKVFKGAVFYHDQDLDNLIVMPIQFKFCPHCGEPLLQKD